MNRLALADLFVVLEPLAQSACDSDDPLVLQAGVVLAALAGCLLEPMADEDRYSLQYLAGVAGTICQHRAGLHKAAPDRHPRRRTRPAT